MAGAAVDVPPAVDSRLAPPGSVVWRQKLPWPLGHVVCGSFGQWNLRPPWMEIYDPQEPGSEQQALERLFARMRTYPPEIATDEQPEE